MTTKKRKSILIVDDEDTIRSVLNLTLSGEDYRCYEADSIKQALERLKSNSIQLVLLDINLSDESGIDLLPLISFSNMLSRRSIPGSVSQANNSKYGALIIMR